MIPLLVACNQAPIDYRDLGRAPGAAGPWMTPSDDWCDALTADTAVLSIDGHDLCSRNNHTVHPVDDPILTACSTFDGLPAGDDEVVWVYDGLEVHAYPLTPLVLREGLHDVLRGIPIFVDW